MSIPFIIIILQLFLMLIKDIEHKKEKEDLIKQIEDLK